MLPLICYRWYHGKISRQEAEKLLYPREDGLFLVRDSNNYVGDYTLCVCFGDKVEHYHIKYEDNKLSVDNEEFFRNLEELVQVSQTFSFLFRFSKFIVIIMSACTAAVKRLFMGVLVVA